MTLNFRPTDKTQYEKVSFPHFPHLETQGEELGSFLTSGLKATPLVQNQKSSLQADLHISRGKQTR